VVALYACQSVLYMHTHNSRTLGCRRRQVQLTFLLGEETSHVRSVLDFAPAYEGSAPPEIFLNGEARPLPACGTMLRSQWPLETS
jgi:hypothetical protein